MLGSNHTREYNLKVNAYGRGLLTRYRQHRLYVKDFNREAHYRQGLWASRDLGDLDWDDLSWWR